MPVEVTSTAIEVCLPVATKRILCTRASSLEGVVTTAAAFVICESTSAVLLSTLSGDCAREVTACRICSRTLSDSSTCGIRLSI